jgi:hypothetical protein
MGEQRINLTPVEVDEIKRGNRLTVTAEEQAMIDSRKDKVFQDVLPDQRVKLEQRRASVMSPVVEEVVPEPTLDILETVVAEPTPTTVDAKPVKKTDETKEQLEARLKVFEDKQARQQKFKEASDGLDAVKKAMGKDFTPEVEAAMDRILKESDEYDKLSKEHTPAQAFSIIASMATTMITKTKDQKAAEVKAIKQSANTVPTNSRKVDPTVSHEVAVDKQEALSNYNKTGDPAYLQDAMGVDKEMAWITQGKRL